jgi:hypothetical protein
MIETVVMKDRVRVPFWTKLNPLWWLVGPDGWTVPEINNGAPYLPDVQNIWLRRFYWFVCRNPLMNFVGYVLGVEDANYSVTGTAPVLLTTWRDASPPATGWKWAVLFPPFSIAALVVALGAGAGAWFLHWALWIVAAWSALKVAGPLPFVSYNGAAEFYTGWRPASGGFGSKLVFHNGG